MNSRVPSSLKFLARQRKYAAGELEKSEAEFTARLKFLNQNIKMLEKKLTELRTARTYAERVRHDVLIRKTSDLTSIDSVIALHPIEIDPTLLEATQAHSNRRFLAYNVMTRCIYEYLKMAQGERRGITEIAVYIAMRTEMTMDEDTFVKFRYSVRHRLKAMAHQKKIKRFLGPTSRAETWYALASEDRPD
jgi:hypothetical protein